MKKTFFLVSTLFLVPLVVNAQDALFLLYRLRDLVNIATPIVVGLALLAFFWGLAKYIFSAGDVEKKDAGKSIMIWGIVALFVIVSIWGIVRFIQVSLGIQDIRSAPAPFVQP